MDMDDDDAFLYGEASPPPAAAPQLASTSTSQVDLAASPSIVNGNASKVSSMSGVSAAMAASLAAYGIDPAAAVVEETPEEPLPEEAEAEDEDEDSDDDEDDVKLVFTTGGSRLDMRQPRQQTSNAIGIGKWAHTATNNAPAPASPAQPTPTKAPIPNQTTEYNPQSRPSATPAPMVNPPIAPTVDASTPVTLQHPPANGSAPSVQLPPSSLAPVIAPASHPKIDPMNPSGIIPSTGNSVYDIDVNQFESSGQPWRRPGSDISDWFNFGFDETTYPKFLRFRADMEAGRQALANPLGNMPNDLPALLHLNMAMPAGGIMNPMAGMNPQQMQQMMQMQMQMQMGQGMEGMMMPNMQQGMQPGQGQGQGGMPNQQIPNQQGQQGAQARPAHRPASMTPGPAPEGAEESIKQEEVDAKLSEMAEGNVPMPGGFRGRGNLRGMPSRGAPLRGRGAAPIPVGPRAQAQPLPANIPKGPKVGRHKDQDRADPSASSAGLDYGNDSRGSSVSRSVSPVKPSRRRRERSYSYDEDSFGSRSRSRSRDRSLSRSSSKSPSPRKKRSRRESKSSGREKDRDRERESKSSGKGEKRKRDLASSASASGLGPGGWESDGEEERRSSRRKKVAEEESRSSRKRR